MFQQNKHLFLRGFSVALVLFVLASLFPGDSQAATLLTDNFTGTTIDTAKWTEIDSAGAGGTSGDIQQNGTLTVGNSYISSTWGARALVSVDDFDSDGLEISAVMTRNSDQLLGYGDYNFQSGGTKSFIIDVLGSGSVLALAWNNGGLAANTSCGTATNGATYRMKIISGGFEVYKNDVLQCTLSTGVTIDDEKVYLQSSATASVFDDVLVTGNSSGPTEPGQVTGLSADPGDEEIDLSWTAPASDGGSSITDYQVEYKLTTDGSWTTFVDGVSASTAATVTGLTNDLGYNFRVSAANIVGTGTPSSVVTATSSAPAAPGQVTGLSATGGNTQVSLSWSIPASNGSSITDYVVEYKLSTDGSWSTFNDGTSASASATVTGLTNDLLYNFRVSAVNGIGTGLVSSTANATPVAIGYILTDDFTGTTINTSKWNEVDPTGAGGSTGKITQNGTLSIADSFVGGAWGSTALISQESFSSTDLEISAKITANSSSLIGYGDYIFGEVANKAFLLYITASGNGQPIWGLAWTNGNYTATTACGTTASGATYKLKIIPDGYEIYVNDALACSVDAGFSLDEKPAFFQTATTASTFDDIAVYGIQEPDTVPDAPTIGAATAGNQQAIVTFSAPADNGGDDITSYTVTSNPGSITASGASSPITVTGLTNGVEYTFTVTATNGIGTSSPSSASNAVTPAVPPAPGQVTGLVVTGVNQQALLSWTAVTASDPVTDYKIEYKTSAGSTWTTFSDGTSTSAKAIVTGLVNDTQYDFRVSALNSGGYGTVSSTATATPFTIEQLAFVITGESNSGGIGLNSDASGAELAARSSVQIMNLTSGLFGFEDLDIGTNNLRDHAGLEGYYANSHGFELQLANSTEAHFFPDHEQVYLVKTGQGGSQVAQWTVGNGTGYWTKFLERTSAAKSQIPAEGRQWVVWMSLGINDAIAGVATSTWKTAMVAHIDKIKADLPGSIVIMTQFQSMTNQSGYATYNAVMDEIAAQQSNVFVVSATGAGLRDTNHWSYAGLKTVASRMATTTKTQLGLIYPGTPTSLGATPANTQVALSWTAPVSNAGYAITDYQVEYKTSAGSTWNTFSDGVTTATSSTVTGLTPGTAYNFRIRAVNTNGSGNAVTVNSSTTDTDGPVISSVDADPGTTSAVISWTTDESSTSKVEYGLTNAFGTSTPITDLSGVTSHSVSLASLISCTSYRYRVVSRDLSSNTSTSSTSSFTTDGCTGDSSVATSTTSVVSQSATSTVTLSTSSTENVSLTIPNGFTSNPGTVSFQTKQLDKEDFFAVVSSPSGLTAVGGFVYNFKAIVDDEDTISSFDLPIVVTFSYDPSALGSTPASSLVIYRYNGSAWNALTNCTVDTGAHTVSCETSAFSDFAIFGTEVSSSGSSGGSRRNGGTRVPTFILPTSVSVTSPASTGVFVRDLDVGSVGEDVRALQRYLNANGYTIAYQGPGSIGNETLMFGYATQYALARFQKDRGLSPAVGYFGPKTRAVIMGQASVQPQSVPVSTPTTATFTRVLDIGSTGEDVRALQKFLNSKGYLVAQQGPGSLGNETLMFGYATQAALARYQKDRGLIPSAGYFGPLTRAFVEAGR